MAIIKGCLQLVEAARRTIETIPIEEAIRQHGDPGIVFVDLRDVRELEREGMIPGAFHAPRGMLEFWIDPASPYYKDVFGSGRKFVFYCASAWRSALATAVAQDMGLEPVAQVEGGFKAWKHTGGPIARLPQQPKG